MTRPVRIALDAMGGDHGPEVIVPGARALRDALSVRARQHARTLCIGRTHGVHAEPTTFGVKLAGFAFEAHRNAQRLERAPGLVAG